MTGVDWAALAVIGVSAFLGFRRGLIGSALSLAGVVLGAAIGARVAPHLLHGGARSTYTPIAALVGATVGAGLLQIGGVLLGTIARRTLRLTPLRLLDSLGGLALGAAAGLAIVWVLGAAALIVPGHAGIRRAAQRSQIVSRLNAAIPPRRLLNALANIDPFPSIVVSGPVPAGPDPSVRSLPAIQRASRSVVRVTGAACGIGIEGSGWAAGRNLVVTAAHVIAGETDTQVQAPNASAALPAEAVYFDARDDIAVLRVPGLAAASLPLAPTHAGTAGALLGYPENGPLTATPVRVGATRSTFSRDAYGHPTIREQTILSGIVRHGDSGGPIVDPEGAVQGMVFAALKGKSAGLAVPTDRIRNALGLADGPVSTGACAA